MNPKANVNPPLSRDVEQRISESVQALRKKYPMVTVMGWDKEFEDELRAIARYAIGSYLLDPRNRSK